MSRGRCDLLGVHEVLHLLPTRLQTRLLTGGCEVSYEIINNPSTDEEALKWSDGEAVEISFTCPHCNTDLTTQWLFPDADMYLDCMICHGALHFEPRGD